MRNDGECRLLLRVIRDHYPQFAPHADRESAGEMAGVWNVTLAPYSLGQCLGALERYVEQGNAFPPTAGQLAGILSAGAHPQIPDYEAANRLRAAVCRSQYYARSEFGKLDERSRAILGGPEQLRRMSNLDDREMNFALEQFRKSYRESREREQLTEPLAPAVQEKLRALLGGDRKSLPSRGGVE